MTKAKKISLIFLAFLLSALTAASGFMIYREVTDRQKEKEAFSELAEIVQMPQENQSTDAPNTEASDAKTPETEPEEIEPEQTAGRNLAPLYEQNKDFLGWLCIPDTEINYPVMHTPYNPQKYLRKNFYGEYSISGVPFLDGRCNADSDNLIIYGHNMKNGTMFGTLKQYTDKGYLSEHPVIEWETELGCERYEIFAVAYVQKTDDWYGYISAADQESYDRWIAYIRNKAMLTTEITPEYGQQLLTLSTCHGSGKDGRLLVIAVQI